MSRMQEREVKVAARSYIEDAMGCDVDISFLSLSLGMCVFYANLCGFYQSDFRKSVFYGKYCKEKQPPGLCTESLSVGNKIVKSGSA